MVTRALAVAALAWLAGSGCTRTRDPCGEGTYRQGDRCIAFGLDASASAVPNRDAQVPELDAVSSRPPAPPDARAPHADAAEQPRESGMNGESGVDSAGPGAEDARIADAAHDATVSCYAQDMARWAEFHLAEGFAESLLDCVGLKGACAPSPCSTEACLRLHAGVTSCGPCVDAEAQCLTGACRQACGVTGSDDSCRACACASGCTALFGSCANTTLDVCADCTATTCVRASLLPPELIMVIVEGMW